jgi:glycosyltransferase involved in cell wall biosynthesis
VRDERLMNLYYNAADVFVLPSLADNLPNAALEAAAAGTPCVTFGVGGCAEAVLDGTTGFVAGRGDAAALAEGISRIISMRGGERQAMRAKCRECAVDRFAPSMQAARYVRIFEELLDRRGRNVSGC